MMETLQQLFQRDKNLMRMLIVFLAVFVFCSILK